MSIFQVGKKARLPESFGSPGSHEIRFFLLVATLSSLLLKTIENHIPQILIKIHLKENR